MKYVIKLLLLTFFFYPYLDPFQTHYDVLNLTPWFHLQQGLIAWHGQPLNRPEGASAVSCL